jgi:hypothetical protein
MKNVQLYSLTQQTLYSAIPLFCSTVGSLVLGDVISSDSGRYWISTYSPLSFPKYHSPGWEERISGHIKIDLTLSLKALG